MTSQTIPPCIVETNHVWGVWSVYTSKSASDLTQAIIHQHRDCKACGYTQIDLQRILLK